MLWKNLLFQETNTHQTNGNSINTIVSDPVSQAENIWQVQPLICVEWLFQVHWHQVSLSISITFARIHTSHLYNQACFYCSCLQKCKTQIIQNIEEYTIYSCYKLKWCICGELVLSFKTGSLTSLCGKEAKSKQQTNKITKIGFSKHPYPQYHRKHILFSKPPFNRCLPIYDEQTLPATSRTGT